MYFRYDAKIIAEFPNIVGGVIVGQKMQPRENDDLREAYLDQQRATIERIGETPLSEIPSLAAWRQAFRQFGLNPTKIRSAPEALLRRLTKQGDIPSINPLVDIGNLVSIRYALPVAVFDTRDVAGAITVHFANGSERYRQLGSDEIIHPEVGEVVFSDETGMVVARRWCWRQGAESAAQIDTQNVVVCVEAQHAESRAEIEAATQDLVALLQEYAGGEYKHQVLDAENASI